MHFETTITLKEVFRNQHRPGFPEPFHKVVFNVESDGIHSLEIGLWVHPSYPDNEIIKVGRSFLAGRLADMTGVASESAYTSSEVDALWQTVKPV